MQVKTLLKKLELIIMGYEARIRDLEKENAELKEAKKVEKK